MSMRRIQPSGTAASICLALRKMVASAAMLWMSRYVNIHLQLLSLMTKSSFEREVEKLMQ